MTRSSKDAFGICEDLRAEGNTDVVNVSAKISKIAWQPELGEMVAPAAVLLIEEIMNSPALQRVKLNTSAAVHEGVQAEQFFVCYRYSMVGAGEIPRMPMMPNYAGKLKHKRALTAEAKPEQPILTHATALRHASDIERGFTTKASCTCWDLARIQ
jgi:hypothetical protein